MSSIQSPLHSHMLSLRHLSQHFQAAQPEIRFDDLAFENPGKKIWCTFCHGDFINCSTSIYCCEKCGFFIHTSCARSASLQIQHPRHEHPLDFQQGPDGEFLYRTYRCVRGCKYELRVSDAMRTLQVEKYYCSMLREASDVESRLQFAHEHPLTTIPLRTGISCGGCQMRISEEEEACGCRECNIFLHEACAKATLKIQHHPFHPEHPLYLSYDSSREGKCHTCRSLLDVGPIRYHCDECQLIFHLSCVISTMPREDDDDDGEREDISRRPSLIDHPLHPHHQLSSFHSKTQTQIFCKICCHWISAENFFGCLDCSFFLHGSCAKPPIDAIQHYLHPEHTLTLAQCPPEEEHECAIGELRVRSDSYCYTCQLCSFFIHPACASATLSYLEKGGGMTVRYSFHEHELKLYCEDFLDDDCTVCNQPKFLLMERTLAYKCISEGCHFKLHKSCWELPSNLEHSSHSLHPLTLSSIPPHEDTVCVCCYTRISGLLAFSCRECNFNLDVICAQKPTLKHPFHEHDLFYFDENPTLRNCAYKSPTFGCRACLKTCNVDLFRCAQCDFNLHYECSQLPLTINSEHHVDPLVLRESYVEEDYGRHYCDICEQRRDPMKWVYFCETYNCELAAHVECALSPVKLEVIEEVDFITRKEDIQKREEDIRVVQRQLEEKEVNLRPLLKELESQCAQLKELKIKHAKWTDIEVIEEDKSIRGEEDTDSTFDKSKKLKAIQEKLETEQANWLINFVEIESKGVYGSDSNLEDSFLWNEF